MKKSYLIVGVILIVILIIVFSQSQNKNQSNNKNNIVEISNNNNEELNIMQKNIIETAIEAGSFNTLVEAVKAAGLVDVLSGEGPFTVFAPTDEAFAKIPAETLQAVLADKEKLTAILTYHVVSGKVMSSEVVNKTEVTTVQGGNLKIDTTEGVKIGNANIIQTDIETSNGVIHVIDTVLMPE